MSYTCYRTNELYRTEDAPLVHDEDYKLKTQLKMRRIHFLRADDECYCDKLTKLASIVSHNNRNIFLGDIDLLWMGDLILRACTTITFAIVEIPLTLVGLNLDIERDITNNYLPKFIIMVMSGMWC